MNKFEADAADYQQTRLAYWDTINALEVQPASNYYRERILAAYRQLIPEGSSVLELGCGR